VREHRLYQADWLLRFYGFAVDELVSEAAPNLDPRIDPKAADASGAAGVVRGACVCGAG